MALLGSCLLALACVWRWTPWLICDVPFFCLLFGLAPGHGPSYSSTAVADEVVVVTLARQEGRYIDEWIEHHLALDVSAIHIFDDGMSGDADGMQAGVFAHDHRVKFHNMTLERNRVFFLGLRGLAFSVDDVGVHNRWSKASHVWLDRQDMTRIAAWRQLALESVRRPDRHVWLSWLDVDEYINPHGADLHSLLLEARLRGAHAVHPARQEYGHGGQISRPNCSHHQKSCLRASFLWRKRNPENRYKGMSLVRSITGTLPTCAHGWLTRSYIMDLLTKRAFDGSHCNFFPVKWAGQLVHGVYFPLWSNWSIAHYAIKSVTECEEHEARYAIAQGHTKSRSCKASKGEVVDTSMLQYAQGAGTQHALQRSGRYPIAYDSIRALRNATRSILHRKAVGIPPRHPSSLLVDHET